MPAIQPLPGHPTRLDVDEAQQMAIARLTLRAVRAAASGEPAPEDDLGTVGSLTVSGVFVSLHVGRQLRGCIGYLGHPMALGPTLLRAARQATVGDPRFTPMSARELSGLSVEAWLLYGFERLPVDAIARRAAIEVGTHGLELALGRDHGVFLPCVPVEQGWDVDEYLMQLCSKAGLDDHAWRDPAATLDRFRGLVVQAGT
jgi:AmmeMemoRadiSam system protein A